MSSRKVPTDWADFWDSEAFPGPRTMISGSGGLNPYLEAALMADGVGKDELYPIDIDRAYASLDNVRDSVVRWWDAGAIPAQMLTDKEAVLAVIWNGRMQALLDEGVPVAPVWNQGGLYTDVWAIPKGAPNASNAQKFAAFITMALPTGEALEADSVRLGEHRFGPVHDRRGIEQFHLRSGDQRADLHGGSPVVGGQPGCRARDLERVDLGVTAPGS